MKKDTRESLIRELAERNMENDKMLWEELSSPDQKYPYTLEYFAGPAREFIDRVLALKEEGD